MATTIDTFAEELEALCARHWADNWEIKFDIEDGTYFVSVTMWNDEDGDDA